MRSKRTSAKGRHIQTTIRWVLAVGCLAGFWSTCALAELPVGNAPEPLDVPHFPSRLHTFVFRNWNLVPPERLADVLETTPENVARLAESMGLKPHSAGDDFIRRGYITLLRRNWHLLPYSQLMQLVDMNEEELSYSLLEDDFLYIKFGRLKPKCKPLCWSEPTALENKRAAHIKAILQKHFGSSLDKEGEPRFAFMEELRRLDPNLPGTRQNDTSRSQPRYIYSYSGLFGDPLMDDDLSSYPVGLLQRLAAKGVNGIWLHVVLRNLAPGGQAFPEFGEGHERRLDNLRKLVARAKRHGLDVYLYMNEPRAMPHAFFDSHQDCIGVREKEVTALCTSVPKVREWLSSSLTHVFKAVPELAGVFTISASENFTNCASHRRQANCPRCRNRDYDEIISDINTLIARGVHAGNPKAKVIVWDWGWHGHGDAPGVIAKLPNDVWLMSVSEWSVPIERGGVKLKVGEYSLSAPGPGPRAKRHWRLAKERGLKTIAKVQLNSSWELSTVPYIPVFELVAQHCEGLAKAGIDGVMLSWSLGGYPSPSLEVAQRFARQPVPTVNSVLDSIALETYGTEGVPHARAAWTTFSQAFSEYPYHGRVLYNAPVQIGPANLLYEKPTGYRATMTGIPYDDLNSWRGPYPPDVLAGQFEKIANGWCKGLEHLERAVASAPAGSKKAAGSELRFARAAYAVFRSVRNQVRFVQLREGMEPQTLLPLLDEEMDVARAMFRLCLEDSRIGFEAANQYFFVPGDLLEKVVNCEYLKSRIGPGGTR